MDLMVFIDIYFNFLLLIVTFFIIFSFRSYLRPSCFDILSCYLYAVFRCLIHVNTFWIMIYFHQNIIDCLVSVHNERMGIEPILPSRRITQNSLSCWSSDVAFRLSTTVTSDRFRVLFK